MTETKAQLELQGKSDEVFKSVSNALLSGKRLAIVEAPPGSGKTHMLLRVIDALIESGWRVALAAQTNNQASDVARRFANQYPTRSTYRFARSKSLAPSDFPKSAKWVTAMADLPLTPGLHVSTTAKWATVQDAIPYQLLAIDEAWQMDWAKLMQCADLSEKFLMIGDPGQIEPVTSVETSRWATSKRPPHRAAPEVVKGDPQLLQQAHVSYLPACRRLPNASVDYVKPFYDFDFAAYAVPGDRTFASIKGGPIIDLLHDFSPLVVTISTPNDGPPQSTDNELASTIKLIIKDLLEAGILFSTSSNESLLELSQQHIGVVASHRSMNGLIRKNLGAELAKIRIDTPERWQGLEVPFMIAVHPLSGVTDPAEFDLATGRLCVMASRQQVGLIFVTRDHVGKTVENVIPSATQPPDNKDHIGLGRRAHLEFWNLLVSNNRIISF